MNRTGADGVLRIGGIVKPWPNRRRKGYLYVTMTDGTRRRAAGVHVLVLEAWHGRKPSPDLEGCHNDGNRRNNRPGNLRWDTQAANRADRERHRRKAEPLTDMTEVSGADGRNEGKRESGGATSCVRKGATAVTASVTQSVTARFVRFITRRWPS